jgi:predicted nucleic acid-binding protein
MTVYVDSSVVLRHLLNEDQILRRIPSGDRVGSSELIEIECRRVLQRERLESRLDDRQYSALLVALDAVLDLFFLIELSAPVKRRAAGFFPTVIGTLDAIHLASALLWREAESNSDFRILTFDRQLEICAQAMGIPSSNSGDLSDKPRHAPP